ncbi:MAG: calcium-binding protein [Cyanobium sp.]
MLLDGAAVATATDTDTSSYTSYKPVVFTGNAQFNHPASAGNIQPKLQGGSITINPGGYIYWDLYTPDRTVGRISGAAANYGLKVSAGVVWSHGNEEIYRIYVLNDGSSPIALANNTNVVDYTVVGAGQTIDLIPSDPNIGSFNDYSNIKDALTTNYTTNFPAVSNFQVAPPLSAPNNVSNPDDPNKVWSSSNTSGGGAAETAVSRDTGALNDALYGVNNNGLGAAESLAGSAGNDLIDGRYGADLISGGDGNDYLFGGSGADSISGGSGNDTVIGSYGTDLLTGGDGDDVFVLENGALDDVIDFGNGIDRIWFERFNGPVTQLNSNAFIDAGLVPLTLTTTTRFIYNASYDDSGNLMASPGSGYLFYDPDGNGAAAAQFVAHITSNGVTAASLSTAQIYV